MTSLFFKPKARCGTGTKLAMQAQTGVFTTLLGEEPMMATASIHEELDVAVQHSEGRLAKAIESQTAKLPSDAFLWGALACMGASLMLHSCGRRDAGHLVGQWPAPLLVMGLYNKLVKVAGSDQETLK
jgi:hypothetical protein